MAAASVTLILLYLRHLARCGHKPEWLQFSVTVPTLDQMSAGHHCQPPQLPYLTPNFAHRPRSALTLPLVLLLATPGTWPAAVAASTVAAAAPASAPVSAPAAPASRPEAVARMVMSLLSYARWPAERETLRLCVDTDARYGGKLMEGGSLSTGRLVQARPVDPLADALASECDALYMGAMTDARRKKLTTDLVGKPVLVIVEEDFECEVGSMFCLAFRENQVSFRINLDAIARSGIHIHPGVLQLGRRRTPAS